MKNLFLQTDRKVKFTTIYNWNYWGNLESRSGGGSSKNVTQNLVKSLPELFDKFEIRSLCDAPCGDFTWMSQVVKSTKITYYGLDIVDSLILKLKSHECENVHFKQADIVVDALPQADLLLVRDFMFHLSFDDSSAFLQNLGRTNYKFVMLTSYRTSADFKNTDVSTGDFRKIDLLKPPYNFNSQMSYRIKDWAPPEEERYLYLWEKQAIPRELRC